MSLHNIVKCTGLRNARVWLVSSGDVGNPSGKSFSYIAVAWFEVVYFPSETFSLLTGAGVGVADLPRLELPLSFHLTLFVLEKFSGKDRSITIVYWSEVDLERRITEAMPERRWNLVEVLVRHDKGDGVLSRFSQDILEGI